VSVHHLSATVFLIRCTEERLSDPVNKASDAYEKLNAFYTANSATITSVTSAVNLDVKSIESSIKTFAETSAVLMKGLDALGSVHPFVGSSYFPEISLYLGIIMRLQLR
jgi:hypothetical protein